MVNGQVSRAAAVGGQARSAAQWVCAGQYVQVSTDIGDQWSSKLCSTGGLCGSVCAGQYRLR